MPAVASLEDLRKVDQDLKSLRDRHADAYGEIATLFRSHRKVGYRNICRLLLGEATPEELKGT